MNFNNCNFNGKGMTVNENIRYYQNDSSGLSAEKENHLFWPFPNLKDIKEVWSEIKDTKEKLKLVYISDIKELRVWNLEKLRSVEGESKSFTDFINNSEYEVSLSDPEYSNGHGYLFNCFELLSAYKSNMINPTMFKTCLCPDFYERPTNQRPDLSSEKELLVHALKSGFKDFSDNGVISSYKDIIDCDVRSGLSVNIPWEAAR